MLNGELFVGAVYLAGLLSFFSPCIFPLLPVYLGMLSSGGKRSLLKTIVFVIGLSSSFVLLGFGAGSVGALLTSSTFRIISAIIVILFGFIQMDVIKASFLERTKLVELKQKEEDSVLGAFILGFTFSLGWTPCVGPILTSILFLSSGGGSPVYGALMMFIYVLGLATPFLIFSFFSKQLGSKMGSFRKYLVPLKKIGGVLIVIMGILLLTDRLNLFV
ncbi:cytochrome c biogenesis CcdA family protein [Fusobacterium gonidiaformans]|uniref:cytochrome c biogenesis CcdA family protein n=1 Tax=Fusobacterium gonidiaformans TaxID=849 RepID=UPI0001BC6473|nr:cytochrome c biogenesis protein CcdA [Fusobacterium gonidiaformans]AVQ16811.1 cytochrome C biogenesis protein CcdA [Fusobacterium gonidiaformans ATCC 25563]EFS28389.1 hypothetical protein FGAG_00710 [Fusobacterium gonidiaformans ATCC 25563]